MYINQSRMLLADPMAQWTKSESQSLLENRTVLICQNSPYSKEIIFKNIKVLAINSFQITIY
jgi:hypothetical protein